MLLDPCSPTTESAELAHNLPIIVETNGKEETFSRAWRATFLVAVFFFLLWAYQNEKGTQKDFFRVYFQTFPATNDC